MPDELGRAFSQDRDVRVRRALASALANAEHRQDADVRDLRDPRWSVRSILRRINIEDEFCDEGISAKRLDSRPGALAALAAVREGRAAGLLVAKMDRLSRSVVDGAGLMESARREGWAPFFADLDIDTSTPAGEMAANIIISGSQYERRLISQRTRDAPAAKRARGERLGAAPALPMAQHSSQPAPGGGRVAPAVGR